MTCGYCGKALQRTASKCPHCGQDPGSGVYQTSRILIATGGRRKMYESVASVPPPLRAQLMKCTTGTNSGTILIADRRGRGEIAKALRAMGKDASGGTLARLARASGPRMMAFRIAVMAVLLVLVAVVLGFVFLRT